MRKHNISNDKRDGDDGDNKRTNTRIHTKQQENQQRQSNNDFIDGASDNNAGKSKI